MSYDFIFPMISTLMHLTIATGHSVDLSSFASWARCGSIRLEAGQVLLHLRGLFYRNYYTNANHNTRGNTDVYRLT